MSPSVCEAAGSVKRQVRCETCGHVYEYVLRRQVAGTFSGLAITRAEADRCAAQDAAAQLKESLAEGCDLVPCPECGAMTREMQEAERAFRPAGLIVVLVSAVPVLLLVGATIWLRSLHIGIWAVIAAVFFFARLAAVIQGPIRRNTQGEPLESTQGSPEIPNGPPCVSCEKPTIVGQSLRPHCDWQQPY